MQLRAVLLNKVYISGEKVAVYYIVTVTIINWETVNRPFSIP